MSFYKFEKNQDVKILTNTQGIKYGRTGQVIGRRSSDVGLPEYLVKLQGKSGPVSFLETELAITFSSVP